MTPASLEDVTHGIHYVGESHAGLDMAVKIIAAVKQQSLYKRRLHTLQAYTFKRVAVGPAVSISLRASYVREHFRCTPAEF